MSFSRQTLLREVPLFNIYQARYQARYQAGYQAGLF
jgi:hypothetical protein